MIAFAVVVFAIRHRPRPRAPSAGATRRRRIEDTRRGVDDEETVEVDDDDDEDDEAVDDADGVLATSPSTRAVEARGPSRSTDEPGDRDGGGDADPTRSRGR